MASLQQIFYFIMFCLEYEQFTIKLPCKKIILNLKTYAIYLINQFIELKPIKTKRSLGSLLEKYMNV